jgi:hypothetical protein
MIFDIACLRSLLTELHKKGIQYKLVGIDTKGIEWLAPHHSARCIADLFGSLGKYYP